MIEFCTHLSRVLEYVVLLGYKVEIIFITKLTDYPINFQITSITTGHTLLFVQNWETLRARAGESEEETKIWRVLLICQKLVSLQKTAKFIRQVSSSWHLPLDVLLLNLSPDDKKASKWHQPICYLRFSDLKYCKFISYHPLPTFCPERGNTMENLSLWKRRWLNEHLPG